jgi:hypothetical protein
MEQVNALRLHEQPSEPSKARESDAFSEGRRIGRLKLGPALNDYPFGSDDYKEWYRGWFTEIGERLADVKQRLQHLAECQTEPVFVLQWKDQAPGDPVRLSELMRANADDEELCDWARRAPRNSCFITGGGAAPACWLRRIA